MFVYNTTRLSQTSTPQLTLLYHLHQHNNTT